MRKVRRYVQVCVVLLLCVVGGSVSRTAVAGAAPQLNNYPAGTAPSSNSSSRGTTLPPTNRSFGADLPSMDPNFSHRQMVARREDLKKHMADNAERLLLLTRDLQTELETRPLTGADGKRLDEIAKLARTVRDQMRQ